MSASEHKKGRNDVQARLYNANPTQLASVCYRLAVFFFMERGRRGYVKSSPLDYVSLDKKDSTKTLQSFVKFAKH